MTLTAMPSGWTLESGTLGTDVDIDTVDYVTGARSILLSAGAGTRTILSKPLPVGNDSSVVRGKLGLTVCWMPLSTGIVPITIGFRYYDATGAYLSASSASLVSSSTKVWTTGGLIADIPANTQFVRPFVSHNSATKNALVDYVLPYIMPPFAEVDLVQDPTDPIVSLGAWYSVSCTVQSGSGSFGSHVIVDSSGITGGIRVAETGVYHFAVECELDNFDATDSFMFRIADGAGTLLRYSEIFTPNIALSSLTLPAGVPHFCFATQIPLAATTQAFVSIAQLSGSSYREVTDGHMYVTKET